MYDRYYIEEKMLDAIKEKITSEYLLIEEKKQKQRELKEQEEKERKRIAAELHDNLGVQANAILHNSTLLNTQHENNKKLVEDLQDTAKEMLHNLRETLWAMKTSDVPAADLWLRIINFMKQMGRHYPTINFTIQGTPPNGYIISSAKALHIVLVLQETVNNAVKHAAAKNITAKSITTNNNWQLIIEDDGKGFEIEKAMQQNDSYGLANMQERAKNGGFIYKITSALKAGTTTSITITE
jgi:signal transduction histidine kinase